MALKDEIQKSILIVNGGSGCLIQPMDADKLYILTAKHVLVGKDSPEIPRIERWVVEDGRGTYVPIEMELLKLGENYFPHGELDAAVLEIDLIDGFVPTLGVDEQANWDDKYELCGYPGMRRSGDNKFRADEVVIKNELSIKGLREGQIEGPPLGLTEVKGQSGGGYIRISNGHLLIGGIQTQMACEDHVEQIGRVKILLISVFQEIIASQPRLNPLLPFFMDSFEHFRSKAMVLRTLPGQDLPVVRNYLQNVTSSITETGLRPVDIRNKFGERLLVWRRAGSLLDEKMWISFLELLIVWSVCDNDPVTSETLEPFLNKVRLLHANFDDDWIFHAEEIMRSDFRGLGQDGVIIVSVPTGTSDFSLSGIVENISIPEPEQQIDQGSSLFNFRYVHIYAFQKEAILRKYPEYRDFKANAAGPLKNMLHQEFKKILYG